MRPEEATPPPGYSLQVDLDPQHSCNDLVGELHSQAP